MAMNCTTFGAAIYRTLALDQIIYTSNEEWHNVWI